MYKDMEKIDTKKGENYLFPIEHAKVLKCEKQI